MSIYSCKFVSAICDKGCLLSKKVKYQRFVAINITIKRRCWKWIGQTLRRSERNIACHNMDYNPQDTQNCGRPRVMWRRSIQKDLTEAKRAAEKVTGRFAYIEVVSPTRPKSFRLH